MCSGGFRSISVSLFSAAAASALFFLLILTLTFAATVAAAVVACLLALQLITDAALLLDVDAGRVVRDFFSLRVTVCDIVLFSLGMHIFNK